LPTGVVPGTAPTAAKADCTVTFADYWALSRAAIGYSRLSFNTWSEWDASRNQPIQCRNMSVDAWRTSGCYGYRQRCGNFTDGQPAYFHAWPNVNEQHLVFFEAPAFEHPGCFCDPHDGMGSGFGFWVGNQCIVGQCPEWRNYRRFLTPTPHGLTSCSSRTRTMGLNTCTTSINSKCTQALRPISVWTKTDGTSWCWNNLTGYNNWQVNIRDAVKAWVFSTDSSGGVPGITRITVRTKQ
jgi:hypothetical protein